VAEFYFDECLLGAATLLINDGFDGVHSGHAGLPGVYLGARDTEWMPRVAAECLLAVTPDRRINRKRGEWELIGAEGLKLRRLAGEELPPSPVTTHPTRSTPTATAVAGVHPPWQSGVGCVDGGEARRRVHRTASPRAVPDAPIAGAQWHPSACPFASCHTRWA